jgi:hypothetical protein
LGNTLTVCMANPPPFSDFDSTSIMRENGNFSPKTLGNTGWDLAVYLQIREN